MILRKRYRPNLAFWAGRQRLDRDAEEATAPYLTSCQENTCEKSPLDAIPQSTSTHLHNISLSSTASETEIVNQLALIAAAVSRRSSASASTIKSSASSLGSQDRKQSMSNLVKQEEIQEEEEESFHHLSSLITVSSLPQYPSASGLTSSPSTITVGSTAEKGDLPPLPSPVGVFRKPCPRYSPLPPLYIIPKPLKVRPEVRF
ncbi:hypothetical protein N7474_000461 [Penicillium riverlandense]|uniref:uncharacterized protein n=1 Tax=Penicillium riverlandense TaxID=1903569 RepID=UPI002547F7F7|nr:uncharacterized protein N7474_000461 [Penicillium riverlandense]KAJ5832150.1 hypothetical protein N7474_000461 [Penicillium riverlandense]